MVSIITAIFGQLDMNKLFYESLEKYTSQPYELIIIDNSSTDGSREYFESKGAKVVSTGGNYSYPYCQNLGMEHAKYDFLAFLNNDMILSPAWDKHAMRIMGVHGLELACCCATDSMATKASTRYYRKYWGLIKKSLLPLGANYDNLKRMHSIMFPNWAGYNRRRLAKFGDEVVEGFAGSNILAWRSAFDKIGPWDNRIQGADFDTYLRSKQRSLEYGDLKPVHIMKGLYLHHYIRLTVKSKGTPLFTDRENLITIEQKWGREQLQILLRDVDV